MVFRLNFTIIECSRCNLNYFIQISGMKTKKKLDSKMREQLSSSSIDQNKNNIKFNLWSRFIKNENENIHKFPHSICHCLFPICYLSNSLQIKKIKIKIRALKIKQVLQDTDVGSSQTRALTRRLCSCCNGVVNVWNGSHER